MRVRDTLFGAAIGLAMMLVSSSATAQVVDYDTYNHLECYQIRDVKDGILYSAEINSLDEAMLPPNTFGKSCQFKKFSREYCVAAQTQNVVPVPPSEGAVAGNGPVPTAFDYICYKVRCNRSDQPPAGQTVTIEDRLGSRQVAVKQMKKLCVPIINKGP
jgi:hypothetical protein